MKKENMTSTVLVLVFIGIGGCLFQEQPNKLSETSMRISSSAFDHEGEIPDIYACDGVSPPLKFSNIPENVKSLVLIMDDPDAKEVAGYTWVHWLVWNISPSITGIEEGSVPVNAREGKNGRGQIGYQGPCPPVGRTHRYFFKLYALDIVLDLPEGTIKKQLEDAMQGHILAEAELIGMYSCSDSVTRILFIGNSHTFFNDLPEMFAELARAGGYEVEVDMSAQGGWSLSDHAASTITLNKIEQEDWDYVILQEKPSLIVDNPDEDSYPAIRLLYDKTSEKDTTLILFMTWGPRNGLPYAGYKNFDDMQAHICSGYTDIANELDIMVAPVGIAWQNGIEKDPQLNLWNPDGTHPSREGSYLSACVFYAIIFQQNPEGLNYKADLSEEMAQFLQIIAAETVYHS